MAKKIKEISRQAVEGIIIENGFELLDVDYVKTHDGMELIFTLDKDGGVTINDCEKISSLIDPIIDKLNPTDDKPYTLVVSSAGIDRPLILPRDFERNKGKEIEITLYKKLKNTKVFMGVLTFYDENVVCISTKEGEKLQFNKSDIAHIVPVINF